MQSLATAEIAGLPLLKEVLQPVGYLPHGFEGADGHMSMVMAYCRSSFGSGGRRFHTQTDSGI